MARRRAWWFLAPFLLGVALLLLVPAALNLVYAFTDHTGFGDARFTGLANARRALDDPLLHAALRATLIHALLTVPLRLAAATGLGLLLARPGPGVVAARAAVYLPTMLPSLVLALVFLWLFNPVVGPVNGVLGAVGLPEPNWFATPWGARTAIAAMMMLPIGEAFLVVLAARVSLDPALHDAARVDGAGPWQATRHVTLPLLAPVLALLAIRDLVLTLQVNVVPAFALTDGAPDNATLFLPLYVYDQAFEFLGFGYGAFLTLVLLVVTLGLLGAAWTVARPLRSGRRATRRAARARSGRPPRAGGSAAGGSAPPSR